MKYVFDLDGTLCSLTNGNYAAATPFNDRIAYVNKLFIEGHHITIFTARGMSSGTPDKFKDLTLSQIKKWNIKYNDIFFGKPSGDIYIDDKGINCNEFF